MAEIRHSSTIRDTQDKKEIKNKKNMLKKV
jgi:hypothetical protein